MNFSCILRFYCCCLLSGELNSEGGARVQISAPEAHYSRTLNPSACK
jgi:hypothetical protein